MSEPDDRKERILHTRVPGSLDRQIRRRARSLGMSVSTVVRHVLLNTFGLVEDIVTDSTNIALAITGQDAPRATARDRLRPPATDNPGNGEIVGWQEAILNINTVCEQCNAVLRRGMRAALAVRDGQGPRTILCRRCLGRLRQGAGRPSPKRTR